MFLQFLGSKLLVRLAKAEMDVLVEALKYVHNGHQMKGHVPDYCYWADLPLSGNLSISIQQNKMGISCLSQPEKYCVFIDNIIISEGDSLISEGDHKSNTTGLQAYTLIFWIRFYLCIPKRLETMVREIKRKILLLKLHR